jgi:predicted RNase H-like HicB family nuclease
MKRPTTKTKLSSGFHSILWKEGEWYVAKCVEIEVTSQGKTKKEALGNLSEALSLFFNGEAMPQMSHFPEIELHRVPILYA